jgi:alpha-glucosidase
MKEIKNQFAWWQYGIIYQVYPRSFQDSDNDGVGDLRGIVSRLDYVKWLGVNAIWISPVYASPMADFGYDISNYTDIHPLFGTLDDFRILVHEVHKRGMKLIVDLVPNHTSNQHPWFLESKSSRTNPKRNWYIWKDAKPDGTVPNNWLAAFGGSAWEWDEHTQQYYYHAFLKEQPDLNWRNPDVQEAMFNVMRFWLDEGVDGFRVDVMWHMIKDEELRDNPPNPEYQMHMSTYDQLLPVFSTDQPEVHTIVRKMRKVLDAYQDRMMIGEIYLPVHKLVTYYGEDGTGAHLPFNFQLLTLPWKAPDIANAIAEYEHALQERGWPNWVLGNHDQSRIASRVGSEQARVAALLLLTLKGTPTLYYGDEIGMKDVAIPENEIQDPQGLNMPDKNLSRDPSRTPMQWDDSDYAGFSRHKPWLPVARNYKMQNVNVQQEDPSSMLHLYHRAIALRQREPSLAVGNFTPVYSDHQLIAYRREFKEHPKFLVVLNLTHKPCYFRQRQALYKGTVVLCTSPELEGSRIEGTFSLSGDEGYVIRLED